MFRFVLGSVVLAATLHALCLAQGAAPSPSKKLTYPDPVSEVTILSSADASEQPALWYRTESNEPAPLLVALHTWSGNYKQAGGEVRYAQWCIAEGWSFIHPNFRGPNSTPEACGSDLVVSDILDAVEYAKQNSNVDPDRIYLIGVSGGGHASLLMAARAPEVWAGVSAWCGISNLAAWHAHHANPLGKYARHMEAACGGPPGTPETDAQYRHRSPVTWLHQAQSKVNLDINHGIHDGVTGSVPFVHALHSFNSAANEEDQVPAELFEALSASRTKPLEAYFSEDALYHPEPLRYRTVSGNCRVTIFEGGHEIIHHAALNWLAQQRRSQPAIWDLNPSLIKDPIPAGRELSGK